MHNKNKEMKTSSYEVNQLIQTKSNEPYVSLWFGNFFEPAYSDREYIDHAMKDIVKMGFNTVLLDSKSWQDFWDRYEGKAASPYVEQQEYMMKKCAENGLCHHFLSIYLDGDNLYPKIRFSPPVTGEGIVDINGRKMRYYRYWSEKAQASMIHHVKGLLSLYRENHAVVRVGVEERLPICSMWDPIAAASFDESGQKRYRSVLKKRYHGDIALLNERYHTDFADFNALTPADYWQDIRTAPLCENDYQNRTPAFWRYWDNQQYKQYELVYYFTAMQQKLHAAEPSLLLMPNLSQWSMFLNINRHNRLDLWDTANRGIDPYRLAKSVDQATFMTVPQLPDSTPNAYVSDYQNSMIRMMNIGREFSVGFYLGRHTAYDIYREITPAEIIGSAAASGADGIHAYGYCGLDDGGVMHKLSPVFKQSIADGNRWAKQVIPRRKGRPETKTAILFPSQMALAEGYTIEGNERRRLDSLGYYQAACDCGQNPDVIHLDQIAAGILTQYDILLLPANSCYHAEPDAKAEEAIRTFAERGGIVFRSAFEPVSAAAFGIEEQAHPRECVRFGEGWIPTGAVFSACMQGECIARFEDSGLPAVTRIPYGQGAVYAIGYEFGAEYCARENEAVPVQYGNRAYYPMNLSGEDPFSLLYREHAKSVITRFAEEGKAVEPLRGILFSAFENGLVVVNHTSYPYDVGAFSGKKTFIHPVNETTLLPHSAVWIEKE